MLRPRQQFTQAISRPGKALGPEYNPWFWNPANVYGSPRVAPSDFTKRLREIGEELAVTWNPITSRWQVWARADRVQHKICRGWKLLFVHQDENRQFLPLDERLFARLYSASAMEHGSAKQYFNRVVSQMAADEAARERASVDDSTERGWDLMKYKQIKNIGSGSKFVNYGQV